MMAQPPQMNMAAMGGPVGGPPHMVQMNMGTPSGSNAHNEMITKLNTAIYDYLLRSEHYDVAKLFLSKGSVETKDLDNSPSNRPGQQPNGMDDSMDIDAKDPALSQRPEGLPLANNIAPGPFLQDWWCQFWETFNAHRNRKNAAPGLGQYINAQRPQMQQRMGMMNNLNQNNPNMRFNNPMMQANGMAMNNDVRRAAMQNSQNNTRNMYVFHDATVMVNDTYVSQDTATTRANAEHEGCAAKRSDDAGREPDGALRLSDGQPIWLARIW